MMTSENIGIFTDMGWTECRPTLRNDLRLTAKERRLLLWIVDLLLVNGMLLAAVTLWNGFVPSPESVLANIKWFATISVLWLVTGTILDIYNLVRAANIANILPNVGMAALLSTLLYLVIPWLSPPLERRIYALGLVLLTTVSLITWRIFYARVLVHTAFALRALVVGSGESALALAHVIAPVDQGNDTHSACYIGYEIVGRVVDSAAETTNAEIPILGDIRGLVYLARQHAVDVIVLACKDEHELSPDVLEILLDCRELGFRISSFASVYERLTGRLPVEYAHCDLKLLLSPADNPAFRLYLATKRALDVLMALVGLLALGLLLPFVALGNALTSPGHFFYRQERMSKVVAPLQY
jgi:FlaA1/EpsC-like NDP-sugar epimerase